MNVMELFGSDFTLMGAALAALALTSLGILRDLDPLHLRQPQTAEVIVQIRTGRRP
jgi:hypothetical protein